MNAMNYGLHLGLAILLVLSVTRCNQGGGQAEEVVQKCETDRDNARTALDDARTKLTKCEGSLTKEKKALSETTTAESALRGGIATCKRELSDAKFVRSTAEVANETIGKMALVRLEKARKNIENLQSKFDEFQNEMGESLAAKDKIIAEQAEQIRKLSADPANQWKFLAETVQRVLGSGKENSETCFKLVAKIDQFAIGNPSYNKPAAKLSKQVRAKCNDLKDKENLATRSEAPYVLELVKVKNSYGTAKLSFRFYNQSAMHIDKFWLSASLEDKEGGYLAGTSLLMYTNVRPGKKSVGEAMWMNTNVKSIGKVLLELDTVEIEGERIKPSTVPLVVQSQEKGVEVSH